MRFIFLSLAAGLVVIFYFWTIFTNGDYPERLDHYYPDLATAFLRGHLYLDIRPKPELLALSDPYDPVSNAEVRLHDASLYKDKFYLYFGPVPAVILYAPYHLLFGTNLPQKMGVLLFSIVGFIFSSLLFLALIKELFPSLSLAVKFFCVLSLGMANTCPFLLRRPDVYEVAVSCAYCFLQMAFLFFYHGQKNPRNAIVWLQATALCIGLAVGARNNYALTAGIFAIFLIFRFKGSPRKFSTLCRIFFPLIIIGALLAWYNFARFGSPLETGQHYQLSAVNIQKLKFIRLNNVLPNIWFYFFSPPMWTHDFPFIHPYPKALLEMPKDFFGLEKVAGLFVIAPVSLFAISLPSFIRANKENVSAASISLLRFMWWSGVVNAALILCVSGATMRYMMDFAPTFVFLGCLMLCYYVTRPLVRRWLKVLQRLTFAGILSVGLWLGLLLSFSGYYDFLKKGDPETYAVVKRIFWPAERSLCFVLDLIREKKN